ncbi:hypothetical protein Ciccas_005690, partial [Cichlidogyrus casuarinus]
LRLDTSEALGSKSEELFPTNWQQRLVLALPNSFEESSGAYYATTSIVDLCRGVEMPLARLKMYIVMYLNMEMSRFETLLRSGEARYGKNSWALHLSQKKLQLLSYMCKTLQRVCRRISNQTAKQYGISVNDGAVTVNGFDGIYRSLADRLKSSAFFSSLRRIEGVFSAVNSSIEASERMFIDKYALLCQEQAEEAISLDASHLNIIVDLISCMTKPDLDRGAADELSQDPPKKTSQNRMSIVKRRKQPAVTEVNSNQSSIASGQQSLNREKPSSPDPQQHILELPFEIFFQTWHSKVSTMSETNPESFKRYCHSLSADLHAIDSILAEKEETVGGARLGLSANTRSQLQQSRAFNALKDLATSPSAPNNSTLPRIDVMREEDEAEESNEESPTPMQDSNGRFSLVDSIRRASATMTLNNPSQALASLSSGIRSLLPQRSPKSDDSNQKNTFCS